MRVRALLCFIFSDIPFAWRVFVALSYLSCWGESNSIMFFIADRSKICKQSPATAKVSKKQL